MMTNREIITVSFNPAWDRICQVDGVEWGDHRVMDSQRLIPAGKALNVNKALAWMSVPSTAAGLWGSTDYLDMIAALTECRDYIRPDFTVVEGKTRQNVTIVDIQNYRELHLRCNETIVTQGALEWLSENLRQNLNSHSCVIFSGSISEEHCQAECLSLVEQVKCQCSELIVDTSGSALIQIVERGAASVINPNLEELSELVGHPIEKNVNVIISEARQFCDRIGTIIVSLGCDGAIAVAQETAFYCKVVSFHHPVSNTVGCGDYLLAGYVATDSSVSIQEKLVAGVKAATAKAWGWIDIKSWQQVQQDIQIEISQY